MEDSAPMAAVGSHMFPLVERFKSEGCHCSGLCECRRCVWCKRVFQEGLVDPRRPRGAECKQCTAIIGRKFRSSKENTNALKEPEARAELKASLAEDIAQEAWNNELVIRMDKRGNSSLKRNRYSDLVGSKNLGIFFTQAQLKATVKDKMDKGEKAPRPHRTRAFVWHGIKGFLVPESWAGQPENTQKIELRVGDRVGLMQDIAGDDLTDDVAEDVFKNVSDAMRVEVKRSGKVCSHAVGPKALQLHFGKDSYKPADGADGFSNMLDLMWSKGLMKAAAAPSAAGGGGDSDDDDDHHGSVAPPKKRQRCGSGADVASNSAASPRGCLGKEDLPKDTAAPKLAGGKPEVLKPLLNTLDVSSSCAPTFEATRRTCVSSVQKIIM